MTMPNFLVIGANKAGTSSLAAYLAQHPEIFISPTKEPCFFSRVGRQESDRLEFAAPGGPAVRSIEVVSTLDAYRRLFEGVTHEKAIGEASTAYLANPRTAAVIKEYIPEVKLVAVLRNPAERAFSNYLMYRMWGLERERDFRRVLELQERRIREGYPQGWHYVRLGMYHDAIKTYIDTFGKDRLRIYLYEQDWIGRPRDVLRDLFGFLGVDDSFVPAMDVRHNVSRVSKNPVLDGVLNRENPLRRAARVLLPGALRTRVADRVRRWNRPRLSDRDRGFLVDLYREDILKLQDLIGRDLSDWLDTATARERSGERAVVGTQSGRDARAATA